MAPRPRSSDTQFEPELPIGMEPAEEQIDERGYFPDVAKRSDGSKTAKPAKTEPEPHYHGHRERLRSKFRDLGDTALADYELLELLLFRLIPRRDTKPVAKALLDRFGTLAAVFGAPLHLLQEVN